MLRLNLSGTEQGVRIRRRDDNFSRIDQQHRRCEVRRRQQVQTDRTVVFVKRRVWRIGRRVVVRVTGV